MIKFYIHHFYSKSLFYKIAHNTDRRKINIINDVGSVFCFYKDVEMEFVFNPELNDNDDGHHLIDFLSIINQFYKDPKYSNINCINKIKGETAHRGKWGAEFGINDIPIMKWLADTLENRSNWIILLLRTEKSFVKYDNINYPPVFDLEIQIGRLKNHFICSDNCFINDFVEIKYPNHFFLLTNTIHEWNELLSIRWYYEFSNIVSKLNPPYDLCFSMRYHKIHRTKLMKELSKLNNNRIFLSRVDNCKNSEFNIEDKELKVYSNINLNITDGDNFDDINWIENIEHYLDYLMRILPMAKVHIVSETWDWAQGKLSSCYLSEKTYGLVLAKIPFLPIHSYPLDILQKILDVDKYPLYDMVDLATMNNKTVDMIKEFMNNFDKNYLLCKEWTDKCHNSLMNKLNSENSLLKLILENKLKIKKINNNFKNII